MFAMAYPFGRLFPLAQTTFVVSLALAVGDMALLYWRRPKVVCKRELNTVLSLSDPNPVGMYVENQGSIHLNLTIVDDLPVQFQKRDFEMHVPLPAGE